MSKKDLLDSRDINRALTRIAHEILEANRGPEGLALVGIVSRGDLLANRLAQKIYEIEGVRLPVEKLDISLYRDDASIRASHEFLSNGFSFDFAQSTIILVDDVLYTGRTVRAALDAIMDMGRPCGIQLAVLVDRGHRELPIKADYVGKNMPTATNERVRLLLEEVDGLDGVEIISEDQMICNDEEFERECDAL